MENNASQFFIKSVKIFFEDGWLPIGKQHLSARTHLRLKKEEEQLAKRGKLLQQRRHQFLTCTSLHCGS